MPGMAATLVTINQTLGDVQMHGAMSGALADHGLTLRAAAEGLGAITALPADKQADMQAFLDKFPPACEASIIAAIRSAIERSLPVHVTWQPATDFEVRVWDVSDANGGMVNVFVRSPDPG